MEYFKGGLNMFSRVSLWVLSRMIQGVFLMVYNGVALWVFQSSLC